MSDIVERYETCIKQYGDHNRAIFDTVHQYCSKSAILKMLDHIEANDPAHGPSHIFWVVSNAITLVDKFSELREYRGEIIVAAFAHDCASHIDRDRHHIVGADILPELLGDLHELDLDLIQMCIREHRSSFKGVRSHVASEAVASADKGMPDVYKYIESAMLYRLGPLYEKKGDLTLEDFPGCFDESMDHILEKFGDGGYAYVRLPYYFSRLHADAVEALKAQLSPENLNGTRTRLWKHVSTRADHLINRVVVHSNRS